MRQTGRPGQRIFRATQQTLDTVDRRPQFSDVRREVDTPLAVRVTVCRLTVRNTIRRPLTELQQAILDQLWSDGPATAERIREALLPAHRLKDSSVRTLLRRLEARGYVSHRLDGRTFVYEATMAPKRVAAHNVRQIIDRFWSGSVEQFLTGMVDEKILTSAEIARLARKIGQAKKRKNTDA